MLTLEEIGSVIKHRRKDIGLSLEQLATFSHVPPDIFLRLEGGTLEDISFKDLTTVLQLLSLSFGKLTTQPRQKKRAVWMASKNISVSYGANVSEQDLITVLQSAICPLEMASNISYFLDETPLELVIMTVEESGVDPAARSYIWRNLSRLAEIYGSSRNNLWLVDSNPDSDE